MGGLLFFLALFTCLEGLFWILVDSVGTALKQHSSAAEELGPLRTYLILGSLFVLAAFAQLYVGYALIMIERLQTLQKKVVMGLSFFLILLGLWASYLSLQENSVEISLQFFAAEIWLWLFESLFKEYMIWKYGLDIVCAVLALLFVAFSIKSSASANQVKY